MRKLFFLTAVLMGVAFLTASCEQDAYEKGEGENSLLRADFVEAYVNADKKVVRVATDDGDELPVANPFTMKWMQRGDTLYRAMLYHRPAEAGQIEAYSCVKVEVPTIVLKDSLTSAMKTDPVRLESVWLAKNGRYLNVGFYLMSGTPDDEKAIHRLGIVADTLMAYANGKHTLCLRLFHDQGGVPQYYSQRTYFSIPVARLNVDSISLALNTYDGEVVRLISLQ